MIRIMIDHETQAKLRDLAEPLELCDLSGRILGRFMPIIDPSLYEELEPRITEEELEQRRANKGKAYTTDEVLKHLESL